MYTIYTHFDSVVNERPQREELAQADELRSRVSVTDLGTHWIAANSLRWILVASNDGIAKVHVPIARFCLNQLVLYKN